MKNPHGLFGLHPKIMIRLAGLPRASDGEIQERRPGIYRSVDTSPMIGGTMRVARIITAKEESISARTYKDRLEAAELAGIVVLGWSQAKEVLSLIANHPRKKGVAELRQLILTEAVFVDFPATTMEREDSPLKITGMPSLVPDGGEVVIHCTPMEWAFHRRVAIFVPEGVKLDD